MEPGRGDAHRNALRVVYPGFEIGRQLLAGVRAGWLKAMRADVGVERKLRAPAEAG